MKQVSAQGQLPEVGLGTGARARLACTSRKTEVTLCPFEVNDRAWRGAEGKIIFKRKLYLTHGLMPAFS